MEEEIHNLLIINQIVFETDASLSVFSTYYLPKQKLHIHLITLQKFQESTLPKDYFQKLSDNINAQSERIIHLWEDVWLNQKDLVQSRILAMIGIFKRINARHCIVERIDKKISHKFLIMNHLQGSVKAKFKYGLFLKTQYSEKYLGINSEEKQLIAVATFSGGRLMKYGKRMGERSYELIRFASLRGYSVMGGIDKLLKAFTKEHDSDDIMTYADRDWSDGRSYEILGFERIENTEPQTFLLDNQNFKRSHTKENPESNTKIFNTGNIKFIKKVKYHHK